MSPLRFHIERSDQRYVSGWGFDAEDPAARLTVEVLAATGQVLGVGQAAAPRPDLARVGYGDGNSGFTIALKNAAAGQPVVILLRNTRSEKVARTECRLDLLDGVVPFPDDHLRRLKPKGLALNSARGTVTFEPGSWFEPPVVINAVMHGGTIQVGAFTGLYGGSLRNTTIGRYCSIAPNVTIGPNEHPTSWLTSSVLAESLTANDWDQIARPGQRERWAAYKRPFTVNHRRTLIGHDVWIGGNTLVRKGVSIGDGAIVGAGSIVTKDVPSYAVVAGVPARLKRMRFDDRTIERLTNLRWWRYAIHDFADLPLQDMPRVLDLLEQRVASGSLEEWAPERATPAVLRKLLDA